MANEPKFKLMEITPIVAAKWLEDAGDNRHISDRHVNSLATDMKACNWGVNGETIKFNGSGKLVDGRHRLWAVVQSGATIRTGVVFDLHAAARDTIDIGRKRSFGDVLGIHGEGDPNHMAAALEWIWRWEHNEWLNGSRKATNPEKVETLARHPKLRDSMAFVRKHRPPASLSAMVGLHYLLSKADNAKADGFFEFLGTGVNLNRGNPVYRLRERLIANQSSRAKMRTLDIIAITVRAWNAHYRGEPLTVLKWVGQGKASSFPQIAGLDDTNKPRRVRRTKAA